MIKGWYFILSEGGLGMKTIKLSPISRLLLMLLIHVAFWLLSFPLLSCFLPLFLLPREEIKLERAFGMPKNAGLTFALFPFALLCVMGLSLFLGGGEALPTSGGFWRFWATHALLAALTEEMFFRGGVLPLLVRIDRPRGLILTSLLFALFHPAMPLDMADTAAFVSALAGGLFLGWTVLLSGSLLPAILLHLLNNTLSSLSLFYPEASLAILLTALGLSLLTATILLLKRPRPKAVLLPFWEKEGDGMIGPEAEEETDTEENGHE